MLWGEQSNNNQRQRQMALAIPLAVQLLIRVMPKMVEGTDGKIRKNYNQHNTIGRSCDLMFFAPPAIRTLSASPASSCIVPSDPLLLALKVNTSFLLSEDWRSTPWNPWILEYVWKVSETNVLPGRKSSSALGIDPNLCNPKDCIGSLFNHRAHVLRQSYSGTIEK